MRLDRIKLVLFLNKKLKKTLTDRARFWIFFRFTNIDQTKIFIRKYIMMSPIIFAYIEKAEK